jgi:hypothetical protein
LLIEVVVLFIVGRSNAVFITFHPGVSALFSLSGLMQVRRASYPRAARTLESSASLTQGLDELRTNCAYARDAN